MEMTECPQIVSYTKQLSQITLGKENENYLKNYYDQKTFLFINCVEKTSDSEFAPPGHTIAKINIDNFIKNDMYMS